MDMTYQAFDPEIHQILNSLDTNVNFTWNVVIVANGQQIVPLNVMSIDINCDYENNYADVVIVKVCVGYGTYAHDIVPYKSDLKVILKKMPRGAKGNTEMTVTPDTEEVFRATLMGATQETTAVKHAVVRDKEAADLTGIRYVELQLQDMALEQIRLFTFGSSFNNVVPGDVLRAILTSASRQIKVDNVHAISGVNMMDYNNKERFDHVIIPHGTPLTKLPDYIQSKAGGIYSTDIGFYLSKGWWYVWGLYDYKRFDTAQKKITILLLPPNYLNGVERTFRLTPNQVIIMATGGSVHVDISDNYTMNQGNAVRYPDPRKLFDGFAKVENNKAMASRGSNVSEYVGVASKTGLTNAQMAPNGATRNSYHQASQLAKRNGSFMMVNWQNSDPSVIRPDMPVQVLYLENDIPKTLYGTLIGAQTYINDTMQGIANQLHKCNTALKLFVEKDLPQ